MKDILQEREEDKRKFEEADEDLCMICFAYGQDKRTLIVNCFYAVDEVVPEMLDLENGYWARICKSCRGSFLGKMSEWREERVALRETPKNHDGNVYDDDESKDIPVRINGALVMMREEDFKAYKEKKSQIKQNG